MDRISVAKDLIDFLYENYKKNIYQALREEGQSPKKIMDNWEWTYKNKLFIDSETDYYNSGESYFCILEACEEWEEFQDRIEYDNISAGAEQIVFVYEDEVIKISSQKMDIVNDYINDMPKEYQKFFCQLTLLDTYRDCNIYTQEKVDINRMYDEEEVLAEYRDAFNEMESYEINEYCGILIWNALGRSNKEYENFIEKMHSCFSGLDCHSDNCGVGADGIPKIFDPVYLGR